MTRGIGAQKSNSLKLRQGCRRIGLFCFSAAGIYDMMILIGLSNDNRMPSAERMLSKNASLPGWRDCLHCVRNGKVMCCEF